MTLLVILSRTVKTLEIRYLRWSEYHCKSRDWPRISLNRLMVASVGIQHSRMTQAILCQEGPGLSQEFVFKSGDW